MVSVDPILWNINGLNRQKAEIGIMDTLKMIHNVLSTRDISDSKTQMAWK